MTDIDALAEELTSAANIVTNDGYYEIDIDAVAQCLEKVFADKDAEIARLRAALKRIEREPIPLNLNPIAVVAAMKDAARAALTGARDHD